MKKLIENMLNEKKWAVVGASINQEKAGNKIIKLLLDNDYEVYCINPNCNEIYGIVTNTHVDEVLAKVGVLNFYTPPAATLGIISTLNAETCPKIWLQPGTYNDEILALATEKGFYYIADGKCAIKELKSK